MKVRSLLLVGVLALAGSRASADLGFPASVKFPAQIQINPDQKLIKEDRDANFIEKNKDGVPVNRYTTIGLLGGCAASNETGWLTYKFARSLGIVQLDNQARI